MARERKDTAEGTVKVRFLKGSDFYNLAPHGEPKDVKLPGDEADVAPSFAAQLIENKYAEEVVSE